jgi:hypothetical protein
LQTAKYLMSSALLNDAELEVRDARCLDHHHRQSWYLGVCFIGSAAS